MHECVHCGQEFTGRKRKYCSDDCALTAKRLRDARNKTKARRARGVEPKGGKPSAYYRSPEYKRIQRFRQARREGRALQHRPLPEVRPIHRAHLARVKAWARYLAVCRHVDEREPNPWHLMTPEQQRQSTARNWRWRYRNDPEFRAKEKARLFALKQRRRYQQEVADDGTVGPDQIDRRSSCLYCGERLTRVNRTIDHMDPLRLGGQHSASNVTECCKSCNSRKYAKPFDVWVSGLDEPHRSRSIREYTRLHGAPPTQMGLFSAAPT